MKEVTHATVAENTLRKRAIMLPCIFVLLVLILLSGTAYAAQDFVIENRTSSLFVVNGTTGNILIFSEVN